MAKFSKSRVWGKVPEESTLIFRDTLISIRIMEPYFSTDTASVLSLC